MVCCEIFVAQKPFISEYEQVLAGFEASRLRGNYEINLNNKRTLAKFKFFVSAYKWENVHKCLGINSSALV